MLELSLVTSSLKLIDSLLTPKVVVDKKEKAVKATIAALKNKYVLEDKDVKALEKILSGVSLVKKDEEEVAPAIDEEKERAATLSLINTMLIKADYKPAKKILAEYAEKVNFETGSVNLEYLKTLLVAKQKYLASKEAK